MEVDRYFTNEALETQLKEWAETYPNLASLSTVGTSYEQRPIWLLTLTNQASGPAEDKPAIWIDANIHATEITGATTAMHVAGALLAGYGQDERLTRLLDRSAFYLVPRLNPDGAAQAMAANPRYLRSGVRPYPWDEKDEGLHEEDVDGDGRVLQMRLPDPNGDWKVSSLDPRLMEKRGPDEHGGQYYRLFSEGRLEDFDGYIIREARRLQGLDFNRNFPFEWRGEGDQEGAGPYPASEPEIRAVVDFISKHPNINLALTFHTFSRVILRPFSTKPDDEMETNDLWVYQRIGKLGTQLTGYRSVSVFHDFKYHPKEVTTGAFDDWMYDQLGVFAFTVELWDLPTEAGIKERKFIEWWREHPHEEDLQILKWADEHADAGGYVDWYPYQHPQLGPVELGGWNKMYTWTNPPPALLGQEAARQLPFVLSLAGMLPHLAVHSLEVTPLAGGEYRVNLVVENTGFLPTYTSQQGKKRKAVRPVRYELQLPEGASLVNGKRRGELGHLEGRSENLSVMPIWAASPTTNRARVEWVLRAGPGAAVLLKVLSERAGNIQREINLD